MSTQQQQQKASTEDKQENTQFVSGVKFTK